MKTNLRNRMVGGGKGGGGSGGGSGVGYGGRGKKRDERIV